MRKKQFSDFSFQIFFGFWAKNLSDFRPKNVNTLSKLPSTCPEEQFVAWIFFKFWIVSDFLQKPLAWFSKFYLRVQIKNCGKNSFFSFSFQNFFSIFERKSFRLLAKSSKSCENYLLRVQRNNLWLEIFFKSFESFWIFCRNLWHGSQISIYVSTVKIAEETVFWFFFSEFFRLLSEIFFRLSGENLQKVVRTTFCVSRGTTCGLKYFFKSSDSFWIFCRNLWHGSQTSIYVSRVKIAEETVFWFFFSDFFRILSEKSFRLSAEKRQHFVKTTFYVSRGTICGLIFF